MSFPQRESSDTDESHGYGCTRYSTCKGTCGQLDIRKKIVFSFRPPQKYFFLSQSGIKRRLGLWIIMDTRMDTPLLKISPDIATSALFDLRRLGLLVDGCGREQR